MVTSKTLQSRFRNPSIGSIPLLQQAFTPNSEKYMSFSSLFELVLIDVFSIFLIIFPSKKKISIIKDFFKLRLSTMMLCPSNWEVSEL